MSYNKTLSAHILEKNPSLSAEIKQLDAYSRYRKDLSKIEIDNELFYVAEGDLLLDEDELAIYAMEQETINQARKINHFKLGNNSNRLLGIINNQKVVRWKPGLVLTYCVLRRSFDNQQHYTLVCENMKKATEDWESTCGVHFQHLHTYDNATTNRPTEVMFPVRGIDSQGLFIASAFFPTYPKYRWRILIDDSYFKSTFDKVGVLRHELGHVLGFRHEHIKSGAPAECPNESNDNTFDITPYDPKSVMHYFCGDVGSKGLEISDIDRTGAQAIYGPPNIDFEFIDDE